MQMQVVAWILAGLALAIVGWAVSPPEQAMGVPITLVLGTGGAVVVGTVISLLARSSVAGFTAGFVGSIVGAAVTLTIGAVLTPQGDRPA